MSAEKAKQRLVSRLKAEPGFVGAGVSADEAGEAEITVLVAGGDSPVLAKVPERWDGFRVRTKVVGAARKH